MIDPITRGIVARSSTEGNLALMYHAMDAGRGRAQWQWALSIERFRQHIDYFEIEGWKTAQIRDLSAIQEAEASRHLFLTFDDGYGDNIAAFEELAKRRMTATWFVVSSAIGQVAPWARSTLERRQIVSGAQLREMASAGIEIGSHSATHADLCTLTELEVERELRGSKEALEDLLGQPVYSFAYPYGRYGPRELRKVGEAGYQAACSCRAGWIRADDGRLEIRRIAVSNLDGISRIARKLAFGDSEVEWAKVSRYVWRRVVARLK